jgi:hypothetical protein
MFKEKIPEETQEKRQAAVKIVQPVPGDDL